MIDRQIVDKIFDAARIEDVVGDFVSLRKRGANLIGLCPFHNEKTGSFNVNPARNIFKCFGCGEGGNSVHFIMKHEQLSYPDALRYLAKKYHIEIQERKLTEEEKNLQSERESLLLANEFAVEIYAQCLNNRPDGKAVGKAYFYERGFTDETIKRFNLGYAPDEYEFLINEAQKRGIPVETLEKVGLALKSDKGGYYERFRGRVMFPIHSISGKIVAFGGRILGNKTDKLAKYVNSPESEIYHKSNELYGIYFAKNEIVKQDKCFLVEGYTDVISMAQAGVKNVVASSGTSLTQGQIKLIHRFTPNITVIYDGDAAGIKASIRGIDLLLAEGMKVKTVLLPNGEDPDSFARSHNASDFIEFVNNNQTDFIHFKISILQQDAKNDPLKKAEMVKEVIRTIAIVPDMLLRAEYIKECSTLLDVNEQAIYNEINKIKLQEKQDELKRLEIEKNREQNQLKSIDNQQNIAQIEENYEDFAKKIFVKNKKIENLERELLTFVIRNGNSAILQDENGEIFVAQYIKATLEAQNLKFTNPLFTQIFEEFIAESAKQNFDVENYFKYHNNQYISKFAAEIITEKYTLSKMFQEEEITLTNPDEIVIPEVDYEDEQSVRAYNKAVKEFEQKKNQHNRELKLIVQRKSEKIVKLFNDIQRVLIEYINENTLNEKKIKLEQLKKTYLSNNQDEIRKIQTELTEINTRINTLSKPLGNRAIIKILK
ncbi:MAG: DNA primase [Prevotellaceae bacterium]|jgi:DNA primase|nr:DNA primase [Prevotellaceae bacterium]